ERARVGAPVAVAAAVPGGVGPQEGVGMREAGVGRVARAEAAAGRVAEVFDALGRRVGVEQRAVAVLGGVDDEVGAVGQLGDLLGPADFVDRPVDVGVVREEAADPADAGRIQCARRVAGGVGV